MSQVKPDRLTDAFRWLVGAPEYNEADKAGCKTQPDGGSILGNPDVWFPMFFHAAFRAKNVAGFAMPKSHDSFVNNLAIARGAIEQFFDNINAGVARPVRINARQTIWRSA